MLAAILIALYSTDLNEANKFLYLYYDCERC